jgi:hypothetical protein
VLDLVRKSFFLQQEDEGFRDALNVEIVYSQALVSYASHLFVTETCAFIITLRALFGYPSKYLVCHGASVLLVSLAIKFVAAC